MEFHRTGTEAAGDRVFDVERDGISERDELRLVAADSADCFPPTNLDRRGFPRRQIERTADGLAAETSLDVDRAAARALKLTRTSITNIEAGKQPVFAHQLLVFARTLGVPVETLLRTAEAQPAPKLDAKLEKLPLADDQRDWVKRIAKPPTS